MCKEFNSVTVKKVSLDAALFQPLSLADIVDIAIFSREACPRLPDEAVIRKSVLDVDVSQLIIQGTRAIRFIAGEAGQPEPEEMQAMLIRLIQIDAELGLVATQLSTDKKSCIGQAESEKKECKGACGKKFCGCFWNSFLAKTNCFVKVDVGVP